jgi:hypothetical protein
VQRDIAEALSASPAPQDKVEPQQPVAVRAGGIQEFFTEKVVSPVAGAWHAFLQWLASAWAAFVDWTRLLGEYFKRTFLSRK